MSSQIKEAFSKVKKDIEANKFYIESLESEIKEIAKGLIDLKKENNLIREELENLKNSIRQTDKQTEQNDVNLFLKKEIQQIIKQTIEEIFKKELNELIKSEQKEKNTAENQKKFNEQQTDKQSQDINMPLEAVKSQNLNFSTRNEGVTADRQTNRQTDQQKEKFVQYNQTLLNEGGDFSNLQRVSEIIGSLDSLKKEIRIQIKKLTNQEMLVFSSIYSAEEQGLSPDYQFLSQKTNLTQSSIRDYIQKLIKKGAPIIKTKENNKKVILSIDPNFKKIAPLSTLYALRNL